MCSYKQRVKRGKDEIYYNPEQHMPDGYVRGQTHPLDELLRAVLLVLRLCDRFTAASHQQLLSRMLGVLLSYVASQQVSMFYTKVGEWFLKILQSC